jgi:hypothetical protein
MANLLTKARGCRTGSWRPYGTLRRCGRRRSGFPAHIIVIFFRYFVWGESKVWVIEKSHNKTKDLIQKMKEVLGSFNRDTVVKACKSLRPRI